MNFWVRYGFSRLPTLHVLYQTYISVNLAVYLFWSLYFIGWLIDLFLSPSLTLSFSLSFLSPSVYHWLQMITFANHLPGHSECNHPQIAGKGDQLLTMEKMTSIHWSKVSSSFACLYVHPLDFIGIFCLLIPHNHNVFIYIICVYTSEIYLSHWSNMIELCKKELSAIRLSHS